MATLYLSSGRVRDVFPVGSSWTRAELSELVGGIVQITRTIDGGYMVINDNAKHVFQPWEDHLNYQATRLYVHGRKDVILGPAVVVDTLPELSGCYGG